MRLMALFALFAFATDQLSKWFVVHWMNLIEIRSIDVLPPFLNFRMGWNDGINFGWFDGGSRWVLIGLAVFISGVLIWWARSAFTRPVLFAATGLIVGGALANALDRVLYGAVADFLNMSCCGWDNPFTFNVADIWIFAGAIGIVMFDDSSARKNSA